MSRFTCYSIALLWTSLLANAGTQAKETESLATGGYAAGVRSKEMMNKVDTDGDGMVSRKEWTAFQTSVFLLLDKAHKGAIDASEFTHSSNAEIASFATGGFARGLQTVDMMNRIDANRDGLINEEEYMTYQQRIFDMMDTSLSHRGFLGEAEVFATGGPSLQK
jgi:hypothetical protein